jgi:FKBP-type peptidyl-prolyl cis-trans isomerase
MKKLANTLMSVTIAGMFYAGTASAQTSSTTTPGSGTGSSGTAAPATKSAGAARTATGGQSNGAAKTGTATGAKKATVTPAPLTTDKQKASYAIGENIGKGLQKDGVDVDQATLMRGIRDGLAGAKPALSDEEAKAAINKLAMDVRARMQAKFEAESAANKKQGEDFLAANKTKDGVTTLPDGLQYKILSEGTGPKPDATDKVVCNYRGTLVNGTEFDSSYKRGQPATFPVNGVIKGWTEALQLMPVGSKWQLFVPSDMAYGPRGSGPTIGPNSLLIFEVELLSIAPKDAPKPEAAKPAETKPDPTQPGAAKPNTR